MNPTPSSVISARHGGQGGSAQRAAADLGAIASGNRDHDRTDRRRRGQIDGSRRGEPLDDVGEQCLIEQIAAQVRVPLGRAQRGEPGARIGQPPAIAKPIPLEESVTSASRSVRSKSRMAISPETPSRGLTFFLRFGACWPVQRNGAKLSVRQGGGDGYQAGRRRWLRWQIPPLPRPASTAD